MLIRWDPAKAKTNLEKHGIRFADAELVLFDPHAVTLEDRTTEGEQRHVSLGMDTVGRILVVVYTYRGDGIRFLGAACDAQGAKAI